MTDIDRIVKSIAKLPPFPGVAARALKIMDDPGTSASQLIPIIQYDEAITANVLKLCNSAYYGLSRKVGSLREGLVLLGNAELKNIILASTMVKFFGRENKGYDLTQGELWKHAVAVGIFAKIITRRVQVAEMPSLFTAALVHDIGKTVLTAFVAEAFDDIIALVNSGEYSFVEAEEKVLGINHAELGARIAESWNFPKDIIEAIRFHHRPEAASEDGITSIIYLADVLALSMGIGVGRDGLSYRGKNEVLKAYGFKTKDLQRIMAEFHDEFNKAQDMVKLN